MNSKRRGWNSIFKYLLLRIPWTFFYLQIWTYLLIFSVWKGPPSILSGCPIFHCVTGCILKRNKPNNHNVLLLLCCPFEEILHWVFALESDFKLLWQQCPLPPPHSQTLQPPRHWLLCPFQQLLPSLIPRVLILTSWEGKAQLEALLRPLCSNVPAATLQQSAGARHGVLSSSHWPALPTLALNAHLKSQVWILIALKWTF